MLQWLESLYLGSEEAKISIPANAVFVATYSCFKVLSFNSWLNSLALLLKIMLNVIPFYLYFSHLHLL